MDRELKTVLVTGGSGFLGINLIRHLRARGVERIRVLDIAPFDYPEAKEPWLEFTLGDVRDPAAVNKCVAGCDAVVNTAAALPLYSPEDIRTTEVDGARNVIAACRRAGDVRMVQISSTAVYGVPKKHPIYEDDELIGVGPYGHAKIEAEALCRAAREEGFCVPIIRPKSFIGPERLGVFALFYDWAYTGHGFHRVQHRREGVHHDAGGLPGGPRPRRPRQEDPRPAGEAHRVHPPHPREAAPLAALSVGVRDGVDGQLRVDRAGVSHRVPWKQGLLACAKWFF